jgi:EmrB/QacA subfamily drug resistance transporter
MPQQVGTAPPASPVERPAPPRGHGNGVAVRPAPPAPAPRPTVAPPAPRPTVAAPAKAAPPPRPAPPVPTVAGEPQAAATSWLLPLAVLVVGMFMSILDTSIVNVALPTIETELGISTSDGQWVSTAYSLAEGIMVPISGWLGYRYGSKRTYILCLAGFTVASILCGLAGGLIALIGFRILQAVFGGVIPVTCMTMLRRMVPPERLGAAMGLYGLGIVVAPAVGPTLGGLLVEYIDWRFIFFVNVPVGVLGVVAAAFVLKETPGLRDRKLDVLGFVAIAGGLFSLLLALEEGGDWGWTSYRILILFTAAVLLIALFAVVELEVDQPLLDLRIFKRGQFVLALGLGSAVSLGMFASAFFIPQFLQGSVRGLTPVNTGIALIPQALVLAVLLPMTGLLYDRFGGRWLAVLGLGLSGTGLMMLSKINPDIPVGQLIMGMVVLAAGVGIGMMPIMSGGLATVPRESAESASSLSTLTQRVSQSLGLGIVGAFLTSGSAQALAGRSELLGEYGSGNPQITAMQSGGSSGTAELFQLYQQTAGAAQTDAYGQAFFVIGLICFAGAVLALFLRSGKPTGAAVVAH